MIKLFNINRTIPRILFLVLFSLFILAAGPPKKKRATTSHRNSINKINRSKISKPKKIFRATKIKASNQITKRKNYVNKKIRRTKATVRLFKRNPKRFISRWSARRVVNNSSWLNRNNWLRLGKGYNPATGKTNLRLSWGAHRNYTNKVPRGLRGLNQRLRAFKGGHKHFPNWGR